MTENLRKETAKGIVWSGIERFAGGGIQFITNIILARILSPEDFGIIAVIGIFTQISQTFIESGFSNALIQKKDRTQADYSTVFFFNLALSFFFYILLYLCSPLISLFFKEERLTSLIRVISINLIIGALASVHKTRLTINLEFRIQALISSAASLISGIISIILAFNGWGIWSLVMLNILIIAIQTILIYVFISWRPSLIFSIKSFKKLFAYSSKILGASLIHLLYKNIYPIVIGKKFSPIELGYFNEADKYAMYPPYIIGNVISKVAFPIFSRIQNDNQRLKNAYSQYIVYSSLIIFPILLTLIVLAKPLTLLVLKSKWLPMVPMLQVLCLAYLTDHICSINLNILYVKGRSDLALRLEIIKKTVATIIFFISLIWGIIGVCWGRVLYSIFAVYLNTFYTKRLIGISLIQQLKDITIPLFCAILMASIMFGVSYFINNSPVSIIVSLTIGFIAYSLIVTIIKPQIIRDVFFMIKKQ